MLKEALKNLALPDLFLHKDGTRVSRKEEWEEKMRPYLRELVLREEYGKMPPVVHPTAERTVDDITFADKAIYEHISFTFELEGRTHTVPTALIYPKGARSIPFFMYINFRPEIPDRYLPVEEIIDNGYGIFTVCYSDITTDNGDFTNGLAGLFEGEIRLPEGTGKIVYWSYMLSRMMDYLLTREEADHAAIGVGGHSRLGKTALLTAALDERFAFTCVNNSGCSGAAISRGVNEGAETIQVITDRFPYWFCPNYLQYVGAPEKLPFDQHALLALVAPRAVFVGAAVMDKWADTNNQFLACVAASPVWKLYGKRGFASPDRFPEVGDSFYEGEVGYHLRAGSHFQSRADWLVYMKAAERFKKQK